MPTLNPTPTSLPLSNVSSATSVGTGNGFGSAPSRRTCSNFEKRRSRPPPIASRSSTFHANVGLTDHDRTRQSRHR